MTYTEQAIQKAIEGGYKKPNWITGLNWATIFTDDTSERKISNIYRILFDPLFWQSLGKSLRWNSEIGDKRVGGSPSHEWKHQWHRFIDHLATGGTAGDFFKTLLK